MPLYDYYCPNCKVTEEKFHHVAEDDLVQCEHCNEWTLIKLIPTSMNTNHTAYHKPIYMYSLGLTHPDDVRDFQQRNPGIEIETDPSHPDFGVPVARSLHEKKSILKTEGYVDKNGFD